VVDSVAEGIIPKDQVDDLCVLVAVFIHWEAQDDRKIFEYNYKATKEAIARALRGQPKADDVISRKASARHPFAAGAEELIPA